MIKKLVLSSLLALSVILPINSSFAKEYTIDVNYDFSAPWPTTMDCSWPFDEEWEEDICKDSWFEENVNKPRMRLGFWFNPLSSIDFDQMSFEVLSIDWNINWWFWWYAEIFDWSVNVDYSFLPFRLPSYWTYPKYWYLNISIDEFNLPQVDNLWFKAKIRYTYTVDDSITEDDFIYWLQRQCDPQWCMFKDEWVVEYRDWFSSFEDSSDNDPSWFFWWLSTNVWNLVSSFWFILPDLILIWLFVLLIFFTWWTFKNFFTSVFTTERSRHNDYLTSYWKFYSEQKKNLSYDQYLQLVDSWIVDFEYWLFDWENSKFDEEDKRASYESYLRMQADYDFGSYVQKKYWSFYVDEWLDYLDSHENKQNYKKYKKRRDKRVDDHSI